VWAIGGLVQSVRRDKRHWQQLGVLQLAPGDRVGWLVRCQDEPAITHLRKSCGDDFRVIDSDWQIQARVIAALKTHILQAGWTGVDLGGTGLDVDRLAGPVTLADGLRIVDDERGLHRLGSKFGLRALVVVRPGTVCVREISDESGSQRDYAQRTGLATDFPGFFNQSMAVLACEWHMFWIDPAATLQHGQMLEHVLHAPSSEVSWYHKVPRMDTASAADLEPVRSQVMTLIERTSQAVVNILAQGTKRWS
jgi:hypothetical protein